MFGVTDILSNSGRNMDAAGHVSEAAQQPVAAERGIAWFSRYLLQRRLGADLPRPLNGNVRRLTTMALIPPFFLDCVVAVGFRADDETVHYQATGFLYGHFNQQIDENTKNYSVYLVTNRHVFQGRQLAILRFNPEGAEPAREFNLQLINDAGEQLWLAHQDEAIDVAVIGINGQILQQQGIRLALFGNDGHTLNRARASELGLTEGDGVFVLGFPLGLVGESRNFVVVRTGCVARIRDCLEGNQKEFLIDCSIFPGNSGSPVVLRPAATAIENTKLINAAYLIGIVASYVPYLDVAVSQQTNRPRVTFEENSGLASVFPVDYIEQLITATVEAGVEPPPTQEAGEQ